MAGTRAWSIATLTLAAICIAGGCDPDEYKYRRGDITMVKPGWTSNQVKHVIGKPDYCIEGEGLRLGWEEWIYPTGSVFFYRNSVKHVLKRSPGTPPPPKPDSPWDVPILQ